MSAAARIPNILSIAGTDPTGGAGIHADLKSIAANGGYGMAVVTALVAQNTRGVRSVHVPPAAFLTQQLDVVSDDVRIDAVKIGMLANTEVIRAVTDWLQRVRPPLVVLDPVMVATSGDRLLDGEAEDALRALLTLADVVTPNISELAILAEQPSATTWAEVLEQAELLAQKHRVRVLAKGGHLDGTTAPDALINPEAAAGVAASAGSARTRITEFEAARIHTLNTHGTGCSLSSALATQAALGNDWSEAVRESKRWLTESIRHGDALTVGAGRGPIHHFGEMWQQAAGAAAVACALPQRATGSATTGPAAKNTRGTNSVATHSVGMTSAAALAEQWWHEIADVRLGIDNLPFVRQLGDGTLDRDAFVWYLAQDTLYLHDYARALIAASELAPTAQEREFWARGADGAINAELQLHESWVPETLMARACPSATTAAYLSHLLTEAERGDYNTLIAALLPCYWLYHDVGTRLHPLSHAKHPYRSWLDTYADEAFAESNAEAVRIVTHAAAGAEPATQQAMFTAFRISAEHEHAFFAAPLLAERETATLETAEHQPAEPRSNGALLTASVAASV